jgi:hypothetical protein
VTGIEESQLYRKIPGLPAPIRKEFLKESIVRRRFYRTDTSNILWRMTPGEPRYIKDPVNQPR